MATSDDPGAQLVAQAQARREAQVRAQAAEAHCAHKQAAEALAAKLAEAKALLACTKPTTVPTSRTSPARPTTRADRLSTGRAHLVAAFSGLGNGREFSETTALAALQKLEETFGADRVKASVRAYLASVGEPVNG